MSCQQQETYQKAINTVRLLSADGVQQANSGHPGMPMGTADFAFTLWSKFLRFDPANPDWLGRDRFVLSAGHGSMLLYSLLHLFGYDLSLEDLKQFRQWGSKTPGHPEFGHTSGVEVTTGPLASGLASAVGLAIAQKQLAARMGDSSLFDQRVYVISGDGCMMEGTSHEACALAGHQKLDNLILFYDDNGITIEGSTSLAMSEDVGARFAAYGWNVLRINGQCVRQIQAALTLARDCKDKPSIIIGKTVIGSGAPKLAGSSEVHGAPLGAEELAAAKTALGFDPAQSFVIPPEVRNLC
ncbi:MAG: transketolase, partial [Oligosphaeraceae bacterium]|nr:transketolase [Oligosphaeraceae bacterium]